MLNIVSVVAQGGRVVLGAKQTLMICKPTGDAGFEGAPDPARTYHLAPTARVVLVKLPGPNAVRFRAEDLVALLAVSPALNDLDGHGLDPHFRSFHDALVTTDAAGDITEIDQMYHP